MKNTTSVIIASCFVFYTGMLCAAERDTPLKNSYWVWRSSDMALVPPQSEIYVYQGDYNYENKQQPWRKQLRFTRRGPSPGRGFQNYQVALLIRVYKIEEPAVLAEQMAHVIEEWRYLDIPVSEVQLDFDCPSSQLKNYSAFIAELHKQLKKNYPVNVSISVTGLLAWLSDNPGGLHALSQQVSYIHYQLYNEYKPLRGVENYYPRIKKIDHPYKLGITSSPLFSSMEFLHNAHYLGTTVFLNQK